MTERKRRIGDGYQLRPDVPISLVRFRSVAPHALDLGAGIGNRPLRDPMIAND